MDLKKIINKYSKLTYNADNYCVGGGLNRNKFASRRHEEAKEDEGKLTFGKACQLFHKATGKDLEFVKSIIKYAVPNMEWHHAGLLPKQFGGGMKKTYFINASEIVDIAKNWNKYVEMYEIAEVEKRDTENYKKTLTENKQEFLNTHARYISRAVEKPSMFYETDREMNGKYGWFRSYGKSYNLPEYYSGYQFDNIEVYEEFFNKFIK